MDKPSQYCRTEILGHVLDGTDGNSDEIYAESWKAVLLQCENKLEPSDYEKAVEIKDMQTFHHELDILREQYSNEAPQHVIMLLYPTLPHYEQFSRSFVRMMSEKVEVSMMWGLLFLVIKVRITSHSAVEHFLTEQSSP